MATVIRSIYNQLVRPVHLAPLAVFRIAFGLLMFISTLRFVLKGWVTQMYVVPKFYFHYSGFEWVKPLGETGMYVVFALTGLASLFIAAGLFYRVAAVIFFLLFSYVELIDKTNYLNHYYFVTIISFLLILLPAHRYFSLDAARRPAIRASHVPNYFILVIKCQVFLVYFLAGVAKINKDWLLEAQPLAIWLPAHSELPIIGHLLTEKWVAYFFSWFGCAYDLLIPFLLFVPALIRPAYFFVVVFHLATALFFNIGMFPYIMIVLTSVFFSEQFHMSLIRRIKWGFNLPVRRDFTTYRPSQPVLRALVFVFGLHFFIQVFAPFRYLLYEGNLFWTEQGYRFSWRVMLMEKAGTAFFYMHDKDTGREIEIDNRDYLTYMQEKMMATQPDMMIDYAKFLKSEFEKKGFRDPEIRAQSYVTLNGSGSREFIEPGVDLSKQENKFLQDKNWIRKY